MDLSVQTMYSGKNKGSLATTPSGTSPFSHTSETLNGTTSISSVPQNAEKSNTQNTNSANYTIDEIKEKYSKQTEYLRIYENDNSISIGNIVVKPEFRNQGVGQAILDDVISCADSVSKTITLTPTSEFGTNADRGYILIGILGHSDGSIDIVKSVVNRYTYELLSVNKLYSINAKRDAVLNAPSVFNPNYVSKISIAEMLEYVNKHYPDILPMDFQKKNGLYIDGKFGKRSLAKAKTIKK
ncbi:MAG: GNAT family N-acetyltransferase [Eubacterium sp.]|nr:GNAT family N-acetyltransferase [Eubacterium sp.]